LTFLCFMMEAGSPAESASAEDETPEGLAELATTNPEGAEALAVGAEPSVPLADSQDDVDNEGDAPPQLSNIWPVYAGSSSEDDESLLMHDSAEVNLLWGQMKTLLQEVGMVGQLLATQGDDIGGLLDVLLRELNAKVNASAKATLTDRLLAQVGDALQDQQRAARLAGTGPLARLHLPRTHDAVTAGKAAGMTVVSVPLHLFRPSRGQRKKVAATEPGEVGTTGEDDGDKELQKWRGRLANILIRADTPTARKASLTENAQATIMRAAGKARASTIKKYVCAWERMACWLQRAKGMLWPTTVEHLLDYVNILSQGTRPTVPETTFKAFRWMEQVAGLPEHSQCTADPLLKRAFETVALENPGQARKQAPRPPGVLLASFELSMQSQQTPLMKRLDMGCHLFRSFGTLRFDDQQHVEPRKLRVLGNMIVTELLQTKTSGPGRRNKELPLAVHRQATVLGTDWMASFLRDLNQVTNDKRRNFLQPGSSSDWTRPTRTKKSYEEAAADFAIHLAEATIPIWKDGAWQPSDTPVVPAPCVGAFTLHGMRALVPSIMALTERDKVLRDLLGRWMASGGSNDYTRTYRKAVVEMQLAAADSFRSSRMTSDLREDDIGDSMRRFLIEKGKWPEERADALVASTLQQWDQFYKELADHYVDPHMEAVATQPEPWQLQELRAELRECDGELPEELQELMMEEHEPQALEASATVDEATASGLVEHGTPPESGQGKRRKKVLRPEKFLITYNRGRKLARLHRTTDRCPWARLELKDFTVHDSVVPEMYDRRCRLCWPKKADGPGTTSESDTSSGSN